MHRAEGVFARKVGAMIIAAVSSVTFAVRVLPAHADTTPVTVVVDAGVPITASGRSDLQSKAHGKITKTVSPSQIVIQTTHGDLDSLRTEVKKLSPDASVEADTQAHLLAMPNDPCVVTCNAAWFGSAPRPASQWSLEMVHAPEAWDQTTGAASVVVAVVDSGVNGAVPELAGKVIREIDEIPGSPRGDSHGTEVASIIAANTNNGAGIAGISWKSRILSVRVADANGNLTTSDEAKGIRDAADAGASVINVSIGGPDQSVLSSAVNYAEAKGALVVAGASNSYIDAKIYPAGYSNVLSVSAVDSNHYNDTKFGYGSWINVYAPGDEVIAIDSLGNPTVVSGTSFATPVASGAAALIKAKFPNALPEGIQAMLTTNARKVVGLGRTGLIPLLDINAAFSSKGYWMAASDGTVGNEGTAPRLGYPKTISRPMVGMASTPTHKGYWLVASDGGVFSYGDAKFYGSTGAMKLAKPIVGMAATPTGRGYWLVASDGGIFTFGDAHFYGSGATVKPGVPRNKPIVAMSTTPSGKGYRLVTSDGKVLAYGDAKSLGPINPLTLKGPIVSMTTTPSGNGYWLAASDGTVLNYGDAKRFGSATGLIVYTTVTAITRTSSGAGYWILTQSGMVVPFGDAKQWGQSIPFSHKFVGLAYSG